MNAATQPVVTEDPINELVQNDMDRLRDGLEGGLQGGPEAPTEQGQVQPGEEGQPISQDTAPIGTGLPDILANLPPEQHDSVRKVFADNTRLQQEAKGIDKRLEDAVATAVREEMAVEPPQEPTQVTDDQFALFAQIADQLGYAKKGDISADKSSTYLDTQNRDGVEVFGDDFGMLDSNNEVVFADHQLPVIEKQWAVMNDPQQGVSARDIYILGNWRRLLQEARDEGKGITEHTQRRQDRVTGQVEGAPTAVQPGGLNLRGERGTAADSSRNVMARSLANAKRLMGR